MATDLRSHAISKIPVSGWGVTNLPAPAPPDDGRPLSADAFTYWENCFAFPAAVTWSTSERVLLKRLCELDESYQEARKQSEELDDKGKPITSIATAARISTEMRAIEATLGLTTKSRRELKFEIVSDADYLAWIEDPKADRSYCVIPLDVLLGADRAAMVQAPEQEETAEDAAARLQERFG